MPAHTSYVRLTHGQKQTLREYFAADRTMTYKQLSLWAKATYKLPQPPSRTTLHRILREEPSEVKQRDTAKTVRPVCCPTLEDMLLAWIRKCEEWKFLTVTGATIREKAAKICDEIAMAGPASAVKGLMRMRFLNGWLGKFLKRHALTSKRAHGEAASVKQAAIERGREARRQITKDYVLRDVFNMDETAYFYCAPPTRSISARSIAGRKAAKKRLTVAVACHDVPMCHAVSRLSARGTSGQGALDTEFIAVLYLLYSPRLFPTNHASPTKRQFIRSFASNLTSVNLHVISTEPRPSEPSPSPPSPRPTTRSPRPRSSDRQSTRPELLAEPDPRYSTRHTLSASQQENHYA